MQRDRGRCRFTSTRSLLQNIIKMSKKIILGSLKESIALIWKNKSFFVFLFTLQVIFFIAFSLISYNYISKMVESQKAIEDYLSQQNLDEDAVTENILQQKSIFGGDPLSISRNFNDTVKNFRIYLIYIFILLIVFISISWALTFKIINKTNLKQFINIFSKNIIILLFYLGLIFLFFFSLLNISITQLAQQSSMLFIKYFIFLVISIILAYFMFISLSLINHVELNNIVQKTLSIGIRKIHYVLSAYLINLFLLGTSIILLYYFIEKNSFILLLSIILLIFSFVFGRIFIINVVEKLKKSIV